jgi:hypothetical protein
MNIATGANISPTFVARRTNTASVPACRTQLHTENNAKSPAEPTGPFTQY